MKMLVPYTSELLCVRNTFINTGLHTLVSLTEPKNRETFY